MANKKNVSKYLQSILLLIPILFLVGGCVTAKQKKLDAGIKPLNDQGFQALFSKPFEATFISSKNGRTSNLQYFPDGTQKLSNTKITDEGTWRIVNGDQCSKWKTIRKGVEKCGTWFEIADGKYEIYLSPEGSKHGVLTVK